MTDQPIITDQKINPAKLEQARALRRCMTPAERQLWSALRGHRLAGLHFRRQQIMDGFIVDFYCHAARLVVEVDGPVHERQVEYDADRDAILAARELQILRFRNEEIMNNLDDVLKRIRMACQARVDPLPDPPPTRGREFTSPPLIGEGPGVGSNPPSPRRGGAGGGVP
jgi:very-short-patch-repair endonuclease